MRLQLYLRMTGWFIKELNTVMSIGAEFSNLMMGRDSNVKGARKNGKQMAVAYMKPMTIFSGKLITSTVA